MKHLLSLLLVSLTACGDNIPPQDALPYMAPEQPSDASLTCSDTPPFTWREATLEFGAAWCAHLLECEPGEYARAFASAEACAEYVVFVNDHAYGDIYPLEYPAARRDTLAACLADMTALPCSETTLPETCWSAFLLP